MVQRHDNIVGLDAAIFMHPKTWKASGHVDAFNTFRKQDSKKRYRADVPWKNTSRKLKARFKKM